MSSASKKLIQASAGQAGGGDFYPYTIENSCRFNEGDGPYLTRTFGTGDSKTWGMSLWIKFSYGAHGGVKQFLWTAGTLSSATTNMAIENGYQIATYDYHSSAIAYQLSTNRLLRDPSAWMHIYLRCDTTNATAGDRVRLYINGVEETSFSYDDQATLNQTMIMNSAVTHYISRPGWSAGYNFDGYMAEVVFIDGTDYDVTSYGEDKNGVWVPKDPSGLTFGTNGFWLDFADSSALGNDVSGNNNDWTVSGLTSSDQMIDTPTNNFATWNPIDDAPNATTANGNLEASIPNVNNGAIRGTLGVSSGKWYYEFTVGSTQGIVGVGTQLATILDYPGGDSEGWGVFGFNGQKYNGGADGAFSGTWTTGDIISVAFDMDAGEIYFAKNNSWANGAGAWGETFATSTPAYTNLAGNTVIPMAGAPSNTGYGLDGDANFGQLGFTYTPPTDFLALCTANLPEPTLGPNSAENVTDYFDVVLYEGTGAELAITDLDFSPDLVVIKNRDAADQWMVFDTVRGATKYVSWDGPDLEVTDAQSLKSFDTNGFTLGTDVAVNTSSESYVAYCWKANGAGVSNTDGTITSTVSAADDSGLSIIGFDLEATGSKTVGHGLSSAMNFLTFKGLTSGIQSEEWWTYVDSLPVTDPETDYLVLSTNGAVADNNTLWDDTAPTSSVFTVGSGFTSANYGTGQIVQAFSNRDGMCKVGYYKGNGSTDGTFVYCGFRPAFVMIKRTDAANSWEVRDSARDTYNPANKNVWADGPWAEVSPTTIYIDLLSNGFKQRNLHAELNASSGDYIFLAFAENPFKYANAR